MHEMWRNLKTHRRWLSRAGLTVTVYAHMLTHAVKFGYAKWHELGYPAHLPTCTHTRLHKYAPASACAWLASWHRHPRARVVTPRRVLNLPHQPDRTLANSGKQVCMYCLDPAKYKLSRMSPRCSRFDMKGNFPINEGFPNERITYFVLTSCHPLQAGTDFRPCQHDSLFFSPPSSDVHSNR